MVQVGKVAFKKEQLIGMKTGITLMMKVNQIPPKQNSVNDINTLIFYILMNLWNLQDLHL